MALRVHLNCAVSRDGRLAAPDGSPLRLSDERDLRRVHGLRAELGAILVGVGTVVADDPSLRVKAAYAEGPDPLRVVLDPRGRTPQGARILQGDAPTLVLHGPGMDRDWGDAEPREVPLDGSGRIAPVTVVATLSHRGVASLLVEGGAEVLRSFLASDVWQVCTVYEAPVEVGGDGPALPPPADWPPAFGVVGEAVVAGEGRLWTFRPA